MNMPLLRFTDFSDKLEVKPLGDIFNIVVGFVGTVSNHYCDESLGVPFIRTLNVKSGWFSYEEIQYVTWEFHKKNKKSQIYNEDILIARVGANMGMVCKVRGLNKEANSANVIIIKSQVASNSDFYSLYLNSPKGQKQIQEMGAGGAQEVLNISVAKTINVPVPSLPEQTKIANFLTAVDEKISLLTQKHDLLTQFKKGVMQQIFSQELRFKDDDGKDFPEWEVKVLADISVKKSSNIAANKIEANEGDYKIYGASGVLKTVDFFTQSLAYISIVKDGAGVGRVFLCEPKTSVLGTMDIIQPKENIDISFLHAVLEQIDYVIYITGSTIPHIYYKDYSKEKIGVPPLKEQIKIANFLTTIDEKITNTQTQLQAVKQFKQGLLQQMFI